MVERLKTARARGRADRIAPSWPDKSTAVRLEAQILELRKSACPQVRATYLDQLPAVYTLEFGILSGGKKKIPRQNNPT